MTEDAPPSASLAVEAAVRALALKFAAELANKTAARVKIMVSDDISHYLIYRVLGVGQEEGRLIDLYQNKGRLLYANMGKFLEEATKLCLTTRFPGARSLTIPNPQGGSPREFSIDCIVEHEAIEIKWRDATTDGDHISKEKRRLQAVADAGWTPVRLMFFYPVREQAIKIQKNLEALYRGVSGHYYHGDTAWSYIRDRTGIDLRGMLERIASENSQ